MNNSTTSHTNNTKGLALFGVAAVLIALVVLYFMMSVSYNNRYTALEAEAKARQDVSRVTFDNTWKIIQQQAQVAEKERESFRDTFLQIMNARTQNDTNLVMKWSQEAQVPITPDLFRAVQQSIESQRLTFTQAQKELIDIKREADTMKGQFPGSFFLGGRKSITIQLVTSEKTDAAFQTGKEDDIDLFGGDKKK